MRHLKIATRLALLTGALCLLIAAAGTIGLYGTMRSNDALKTVYEDRTVPVADLATIRALADETEQHLLEALALPDEKALASHAAAIDEHNKQAAALWKAYMATYLTPEEKVLAQTYATARETFEKQALTPVTEALRQGRMDVVRRMMANEVPPLHEKVDEAMAALTQLQLTVAKAEYVDAQERMATLRTLTIAAVVGGVLLAAIAGWWLSRSITRALGAEPDELRTVVDAVAAGRLNLQLNVRAGDTASVIASVQRMSQQLSGTVGTVREIAGSVASAAAQIAAGNTDLSARTEEQAATLEQTAASTEELATTGRHNADNASQANQLANGAATVAQQGGEVVAQVVETMKGISDSSKRIADIIGVIEGIAFQTNILALNAAVEAARAGEQGRGFAVVASEVRTLAQRSDQAAKEIKGLIGDSVTRVQQGSGLVDRAGQTMQEVVHAVRRVSDIVDEISRAAIEHTSGVGQLNDAITQMDQVTQQNASLVEESAAASESLRQQAQRMVEAVSVFEIAEGATAQAAAPVAPAQAGRATSSARSAERRGPNRARNVVRPSFAPAAAPAAPAKATGTDDWTTF